MNSDGQVGCHREVGNRHSRENNVKKRKESEFHGWVQTHLDRIAQWFPILCKTSTIIYFVTHHFVFISHLQKCCKR